MCRVSHIQARQPPCQARDELVQDIQEMDADIENTKELLLLRRTRIEDLEVRRSAVVQ